MRQLAFFLITGIVCAGSLDTSPRVVNHDIAQLPSLPSFDVHPGGRITYIWSTYERHSEWLWTTSFSEGAMTPSIELSPGHGIYTQPRMVATGPNSGWAFWARMRDGRWEVVGRNLDEGKWSPLEILSAADQNAMLPAVSVAGGNVVLAYELHTKPQQIAVRVWNGQQWAAPVAVSDSGSSYRPVLATGADGKVWAFWDSYLETERAYAVFGRIVAPRLGPVERLSPKGRNCLKPSAVHASKAGLAVAWVSTNEVQGGAGVLDHWDTIQVAIRGSSGWQLTKDGSRDTDIVPLAYGLLPRIEPEYEPVWGYFGRRRQPILIDDNGTLRLLWERRIHSGGQSYEPGQLCARSHENGQWTAPAVLHQGLVEYAVPENAKADAGQIPILGRDLQHRFQTLAVDLDSGKPFAFEDWPGWKKVQLPLRAAGPRPTMDLDGKRYNLYWGDLHVHSVLTPDAEGEVDELMHFARDKSQIDVIVVQENDSNSWSKKGFVDHRLNASEYALSVYYSRRYTEPGRFVALPGFEWSQRTADDNNPNHRTVMYAGVDAPIVRHTENNNSFDELCQVVVAAGGNMFTQHEAFRLSGCPADTNVEVASGWSAFIFDPEKIHADLSAGHRIGFVATGDAHRRNPGTGGGLTAIYATELTPAAILDALASRRVYATNGSRIVLDARANGRFMGEDVETPEKVDLSFKVTTPRPMNRVLLVRDGKEILMLPAKGQMELRHTCTDRPGSGFHWYYWRVELEGKLPHYRGNVEPAEGLFAWSSPHRVTVK